VELCFDLLRAIFKPRTGQCRRHGESFGGLSPPNTVPSPPKLKYKTLLKSVFLSSFRISSFWRRFWDGPCVVHPCSSCWVRLFLFTHV